MATKNQNKLREFREILEGIELVSESELGVDIDVEETGLTFEENSMLKAKAVYEKTGLPSLADDSGLSVDALSGEPGVYSARYGGEGLDDKGRVRLLLKNMEGIPGEKRGASFICAITMVSDKGIVTAKGECRGEILTEPVGENGFGYDPVFYVREYGKTTAQMSAEEKNSISHRGKALRQLKEKLGI